MTCTHCGEDICDACWKKRADIAREHEVLAGENTRLREIIAKARGASDWIHRGHIHEGLSALDAALLLPLEPLLGVKAGDDHVPGERSTSEYSELAIAVARDDGRLRVDRNGLGWIHDMEPDKVPTPNRCTCGDTFVAVTGAHDAACPVVRTRRQP